MDESPVHRYVCMDQAEPSWRFVRSEGALAMLLLLGALGVIAGGNALSVRFEVPRAAVQIPLYALLLLFGWAAYRRGLIAYRYTLTDRELIVERVIGARARRAACVALSDIDRLAPYGDLGRPIGRPLGFFTGRRRDALAIVLRSERDAPALLMNPGEEFTKELMAQWTNARA